MSDADLSTFEPDYTVTRVGQILKDKGWTMYRLAKETGLAYSSLTNPLARGVPYSLPCIEKICEAVGISLKEFFQ